ncbi:hypothetical protein CROQUDRAFT_721364 [Cronartium quercuum f. sp. fusiforme G11]|uniref:Uncharacterized protein n=1 Tax=Cronartium quercuum f. sp. fusiforme G11 TaxID=708437 RepID=A0A9P6TFU1_9BASI|nr:hypothetical protein CROQUDRAFT_721364 [Cronartium quercuum f. sp. fusiforme G11]
MDHPIIIQGAPADWTSMGDVLINNSNITNTVSRLDPFKLLSIEIENYGNWKDANIKRPVWSVSLLAAYLLAYIVQLVLLTRGILLSSWNKSGWFFRKNKDGLILPNTRFLVACSSLAFVIVQFIDTIFFLIETTGNRLHRERYSISGFQWFTLWQSALILVWGIATSLFMTAYKQGGIVGRLVGKTTTATLFNMIFIGSSICAILSQLITFSVVIAKIRKLTLLSKTTIEELDLLSAEYDPKRVQASDLDFAKRSILRLGQLTKKYFQVVKAIFYLRLTWSVLLVLISLPLGYMHIHSLLRVGAHRDRKSEEPTFTFTNLSSPSEVDQEQGVVKPYKTRSRENSVTSIKTSTSSTAGSIEAERSSVIANTILIFFHILVKSTYYSWLVLGRV